MGKVIVVGGGWAGCAAAMTAVQNGAEVILLERTDMLLGTGLVGGIMRNNGRFTAEEEMRAMGGGGLFEVIAKNLKHKNINFPGHDHADLYDVHTIQGHVRDYLDSLGIKIYLSNKISSVVMKDKRILAVSNHLKECIEGDVFVDATGTAGPVGNCSKYGNGCAMCILRCPSFGGRVSLSELAGVKEIIGKRVNGTDGSMSGSCKLSKESLSEQLNDELNKNGVVIVPLPIELAEDHLDIKCCQQYALEDFKHNLILLDTGHAKLMTPYYSLEKLRKIPGFENARYEDPYAGGKGNSMRFFAMAPRNDALLVNGIENLFCAGEKAGLLVGHTEAIITGVLAGYNCTRYMSKQELLILPRELAVGDAIAYVREEMETGQGLTKKVTFSGSGYFERMKELGLYKMNSQIICKLVSELGLYQVFASRTC